MISMDGHRFDSLIKVLGAGTSRRRLLAGIGSLTGGALLVGIQDAAAQPGKGKGRGQTKVGLCHHSDEGAYHFIRVGAPAANAHVTHHGDQLCPTDDPCNTYTTCDQTTGACVATAAANEGGACTDPDTLVTGTCVLGVCTPPTTTT
jgi:hypothetical protein